VLVTSQELLRVPGEHAFGLEPLDIPPPGLPFDIAQGYSALRLLAYRARSVDRRFTLSAANLPVAIDLVRRLDGNPLAIEMAAARIPLLGLETLASRLEERLLLLRNAARSALSRHQTLRATLEWSHGLLDPREQSVLRRLAVFAGSFRVDTAQRAIAGAEMDEWVVLDALSALVDKSLVQTERLDPPRYRLLETMRLFCAEQLQRCGDAALAEQRHGTALAELAEAVEHDFWEMSDAAWLARYAAEYDDLQIAFDRALGRHDVEVAAATGIALVRLDHLRSVNAPRLARAAALYALLPDARPRARAWIWSCIASHGLLALDVVSRLEAANQAVAAWREQGDPMRLHFALGFLASESARARDFVTAARMLDEVRALEHASWPCKRLMWGASVVAGVCIHLDDAQGYREASRRELVFAERAGADRAAAWARLKLADAALMAGDCAEAIELGRAAVDELRSSTSRRTWAWPSATCAPRCSCRATAPARAPRPPKRCRCCGATAGTTCCSTRSPTSRPSTAGRSTARACSASPTPGTRHTGTSGSRTRRRSNGVPPRRSQRHSATSPACRRARRACARRGRRGGARRRRRFSDQDASLNRRFAVRSF
jgi:predicted ATPase